MSDTKDVLEIVTEYLKANDFDGLFHHNGECACLVEDLAPCGEILASCRAGYKLNGCSVNCGMGCDFHIVPVLPPPASPDSRGG